MNDELKNMFLKRFEVMFELVNINDSREAMKNELLKTYTFNDENEIEFKKTMNDIQIKQEFYGYQNEIISDFDVLTYILMPENEKQKWVELVTEYKTYIDGRQEIFEKLN